MHATLLLSATLLSVFPAAHSIAAPPSIPGASPGPIAAPPAPAATDGQTATPTTPAPVARVLAARPFKLGEPFQSDWRLERPMVRSGWLLVIEADANTARPRQTASPVLYVGDQVAERLNDGGPASHDADTSVVRLVVLVPAPLGDDGAVVQPLLDVPAYFGTAMLPEQVDAVRASSELAAARAAGVKAPARTELDVATARGGSLIEPADRAALLKVAAGLLREWSPTEIDQADLLEGRPVTAPSASAPGEAGR